MPNKHVSREIRQMAELQHAEIVGRIHAGEHLETEMVNITDPRVLYGWNLLTQEVLICLAEASLKLLYMLWFDEEPPHGHSLAELWDKLPLEVQEEVQVRRQDFPDGGRSVSFSDYHMDDFQDGRYSFERRVGGQTTSFEPRRLYLDSFAARDVAEDWLGEIAAWPWAGFVVLALAGYEIIPTGDGRFDVWVKNPIQPMDWAGAIIEPKGDQFVWTLYCGFTDTMGKKRSYKIECLHHLWPIEYFLSDTVEECAEKIQRAYQEPSPALLAAIEEAAAMKGDNQS